MKKKDPDYHIDFAILKQLRPSSADAGGPSTSADAGEPSTTVKTAEDLVKTPGC